MTEKGALPGDVLVAIPAHNERDTVAACLGSVVEAVRVAVASDAISRCRIAVAAHRCSDDTARVADALLAEQPDLEHLVVEEPEPLTVGGVRSRLIHRATADGVPLEPRRTWLFSTDADTTVPGDWVTATLATAAQTGADMVLGMTDLLDWNVPEAAQAAYERIISSGITAHGHHHVYAANLAIRLDVFQQVGGFPSVLHGEERELLSRVTKAGYRTVSALAPRVRTSARMPGRAEAGLGSLLARLVESTGTA